MPAKKKPKRRSTKAASLMSRTYRQRVKPSGKKYDRKK
jgi:hypothetical protein|tara:strand:- start:1 stop:114 length:114 start_codon:yes stop_codon:yes gene_type:complete